MVPIGLSQVQNVSATDVQDMGVVALAGVMMALVPHPVVLDVLGRV